MLSVCVCGRLPTVWTTSVFCFAWFYCTICVLYLTAFMTSLHVYNIILFWILIRNVIIKLNTINQITWTFYSSQCITRKRDVLSFNADEERVSFCTSHFIVCDMTTKHAYQKKNCYEKVIAAMLSSEGNWYEL